MPNDGPPIVPGVTETKPAPPPGGPLGFLLSSLASQETTATSTERDAYRQALELLRRIAAGEDERLAARVSRALEVLTGRDDESTRARDGGKPDKAGSLFAGVNTPI